VEDGNSLRRPNSVRKNKTHMSYFEVVELLKATVQGVTTSAEAIKYCNDFQLQHGMKQK
jgi:hypothetical protein